MSTAFDFLTVACFIGLVTAFALHTERDTQTLTKMLPSAVAFGIANQAGNEGFNILALVLIISGAGYALLIVFRKF